VSNPANRFERLHLEPDPDIEPESQPAPQTHFLKDHTASLLTRNDSPDVGFDTSLNPYRGCEHGCIYCYARPTHEYLGFSAGLDFEAKILVKENAPDLLRRELASPKWKPRLIALSSATDCYQPAERRLRLTRRCLEVLAECRNPVCIVTKNFLVTRDVDILQELARHNAVAVCLSITSMDASLARILEPRTSAPSQRFAAIQSLAKAGIPVGVLVAPVIPALTDHDMIRIIQTAADAGARFASYEVLRLPHGVKDLFKEWLTIHAPGQKEKILNRIRSIRDGKLNDPQFDTRMVGKGIFAEQIGKTFAVACHKAGITDDFPELSVADFRPPQTAQLRLL
jgi:DNA repair photolyase